MGLYLAFGTFLFLLAFLRACGALDRRYDSSLALCLTLVAYAASFLRWETGADWDNYIWMFRDLKSIDIARDQDWWEPGYAYLAVFTHYLGGSYSVFLLFVATILFLVKFLLLRTTTTSPLIAIFVLYCTSFYDVFFTRQSVAVIFFWGFAWFYYRKAWTAAALAAGAALMFHTSALVPIALIIGVSSLHWKRLVLLSALFVGLCIVAFQVVGIVRLMELVGYGGYAEGFVEVKAGGLSTTARAFAKLSFWVGVLGLSIAYVIPHRDRRADEGWLWFCARGASAIIGLSMLLVPVSEIFARIPDYGRPLFAVILSGFAFRFRQVPVGAVAYLFALLLLFIQLAFLFGAYPESYYPFRSIVW